MSKKATLVAATPQLRDVDELASIVFSIISDGCLEFLNDRYGPRTQGLSAAELDKALSPYLYNELLPLHGKLRTPESITAVVKRLFLEATAAMTRDATVGGIFWDPFVEFLTESHRRHILRMAQQAMPSFCHKGAYYDFPRGLQQVSNVQRTEGAALLVMRDEATRRELSLFDEVSLQPITDPTRSLQSSIVGLPTAIACIPAPYHRLVVSFASSVGSSMGFFERDTGRLIVEAPMLSHQSCMQWMPRLSRLVCGSALGELSIWMASGKFDTDIIQPHNGPIVFLGHLQLQDAILSVGSDGKAAVTDAPTITELCSKVVSENHITCAAFNPALNVFAVGGGSSTPSLWSASLPPYSKGIQLSDSRNSHKYVVCGLHIEGDELISVDTSGLLKVWDLRTAKCLQTLPSALGEEQRKNTTFSKVVDFGPSLGVGMVSDDSVHFVRSMSSAEQQFVPKADESPIDHFEVIGGHYLVTCSSTSVRLWSCRTGDLHGICEFPKKPVAPEGLDDGYCISCMVVSDADHAIFLGDSRGGVYYLCSVDILSNSAVPVYAPSVVNGDVRCMVCCGRQLFVGALSVVSVLDVQDIQGTPPLVLHGIEGAVCGELFADLTGVALMSASHRLYIIEATDSSSCIGVEDFRQYDLTGSLRYQDEPSRVFCFLGSLDTLCIADGPDLSVLWVGSAKSRRLISFPSVNSRVSSVHFEHGATGKSILTTLEDDGTCAIYALTDFMATIERAKREQGFLESSRAPPIHATFHVAGNQRSGLLPTISIAATSGSDCSCTIFRFDGVKIGDLDMYHGGSSTRSWLPITSKTRRGSNIVFRINYDSHTYNTDRQKSRHMIRFGDHHPVVGMTDAQRASAAVVTRPTLQQLQDPLSRLGFIDRLKCFKKPDNDHNKVIPVRGERSTRTLEPLEVQLSKWAVDSVPKKERNGMQTLTGMRALTMGFLPNSNDVKESRQLARSNTVKSLQSESPTRPSLVSKRPRLQPLHVHDFSSSATVSASLSISPSPLAKSGSRLSEYLPDDSGEQFFVV